MISILKENRTKKADRDNYDINKAVQDILKKEVKKPV
jgi:hypothetical protein